MFRRVNLINQVLRSQNIAFASTVAPKTKAIPLVTCKNAKLNLMYDPNQKDKQKDVGKELELASKGWQHYKAKKDHFTIHPVRDVIEANLRSSVDFSELNVNEKLIKNMRDKHDIVKATKLQQEAIVKIRDQNNNVLIAAETGCGKV
jgi:HrpA-like RNA helicase